MSSIITTLPRYSGTSLNGKWCYLVDQLDTGYLDHFGAPIDEWGRNDTQRFAYFFDGHLENPSEWVEYGFVEERSLDVPGDWNSQVKELFYYEGNLWYCKRFDLNKKDPVKRYFVQFGAVNYKSDVYLNGKKLGVHVGGYTGFSFEVTEYIKEGKNSLVVHVTNVRAKQNIPTLNQDWWNYGGITRDVNLYETPAVFAEDFTLQLKNGEKSVLEFALKVNGTSLEQKIKLSIPELGLEKEFLTDKSGKLKESFTISDLTLWSPENPKLYSVEITCAGKTITDRIGFRSIKVIGTDILLNGKSVFLRGVCIHEENPIKGGRANTVEEARMLLGWAKELNCNFVRLAHYPHNEQMIRVADEMGLLVWSEIPVYWGINWDNPSTLENGLTQLTENIMRDKNRACVIIWSLANETVPGEARNSFLSKLADRARELDSTRLISAALEKHYLSDSPDTATVEDPFAEKCDVVSFNQYVGWYDGLPEKCSRVKWEIKYNKPIIISEFGGDALGGKHGKQSERWTEEFQEELYKQNVSMLKKIPQLRGTAPWILADFRSPKRLLPYILDGWNRKGLISQQGEKKLAFNVMRSFYKELETQYK
ncbi:MAG: beta-glucuronidase [Fibrobacteres bacterium]|nr:beta-glucuronidase [Fibrobacterota bacterium]